MNISSLKGLLYTRWVINTSYKYLVPNGTQTLNDELKHEHFYQLELEVFGIFRK